MKEYCSDCLNLFPEEELQCCICTLSPFQKRTIVTKSGVKEIIDKKLYCKNCLTMHHEHIGETFI